MEAARSELTVEPRPCPHLNVSMRSFRAERLADWVQALLGGNVPAARSIFSAFHADFPIRITRSPPRAKAWLRRQTRGSERHGLAVSSQAHRLRPLAIDVRHKPDIVHWLLGETEDIRSSLFLEDTASEFDIQGLELDWVCLVWDGDLRRTASGWDCYTFKGNRWAQTHDSLRKAYQLNTYRVLLTRARQGMVICVPEGNPADPTRLPSFYAPTYTYLRSLSLPEL